MVDIIVLCLSSGSFEYYEDADSAKVAAVVYTGRQVLEILLKMSNAKLAAIGTYQWYGEIVR